MLQKAPTSQTWSRVQFRDWFAEMTSSRELAATAICVAIHLLVKEATPLIMEILSQFKRVSYENILLIWRGDEGENYLYRPNQFLYQAVIMFISAVKF